MLPPIRHLFTDLIPRETDIESSSSTLDAVSPFRSVTGTPSSRITAQNGGLTSYTHSPFSNPGTVSTPVMTRGDESYLSLRNIDHLKGRLPAVSEGARSSNVPGSEQVQMTSRDRRPPSLAGILRSQLILQAALRTKAILAVAVVMGVLEGRLWVYIGIRYP